MLNYNEITLKKIIIYNGEPHEVVGSHVFRKQQRKPVNQTKLKNLVSGKSLEITFHQNEKVEEAEMGKKDVMFLYKNEKKGEFWFTEVKNQKNRFTLDSKLVEADLKFIKENTEIEAKTYINEDGDEEIVGLRIPVKVELAVTDAPPSIKGNTASGGGKQVVLETGAVISAPLFINIGDILRINTEKGEYVERVT